MYSMPQEYTDNVQSTTRHIVMYAAIGIGVDQTAADDLSSIAGDFLPFSNPAQVIDAVYSPTEGMCTFEGDGIPTNADNGLVAPPLTAMDNPPELGVWSSEISDAEGNIDVTIVLVLNAEHTSAFRVYTYGPNVTEAEIIFGEGEDAETVPCECFEGYFSIPVVRTYSKMSIHVTRIDRPFCHFRVVEAEFGSSITFSSAVIAGEVVNVRELDPSEVSIPLDELDLSVVNVDGAYDSDNPNTRLNDVAIGTPMTLGFTLEVGEESYTVPCGRYYIGELTTQDTRLSVVAFDPRWILSRTCAAWTMSSSISLGETLDDLLTSLSVPHTVEPDAYNVTPEADHTFDDQSSILDNILLIQQAYGVYLVPDRDNTIHITASWPGGDSAVISADTIYSWPKINQTSAYNVVSIGYNSGGTMYYVERDLRDDTKESKSVLQIADNPLITTQARATALLNRIVMRIPSSEVEAKVMGDPAIDLGDTVQIPGRWSIDTPKNYRLIYEELTFDGSLSCIYRGQS